MPFLFYGEKKANTNYYGDDFDEEEQCVDTSPIYVDSSVGGGDDLTVMREIAMENHYTQCAESAPYPNDIPPEYQNLNQNNYLYIPTGQPADQQQLLNSFAGITDILKKVNCNI